MILIQIILIVAFVIVFVRLMSARGSSRTNAYKKLSLLLFIVAAIVSVLFPSLLTSLANLVGVGRGAWGGLTVIWVDARGDISAT